MMKNLKTKKCFNCFTFFGVIAISILSPVTPAQAAQNTLGKATLTRGVCQGNGLANGSCYRAVISGCPEAPSAFAANVKVNQPPNTNKYKGTVVFTTGGSGQAFYDYDQDFLGDARCSGSNCGLEVVSSINKANYRTIQIEFVDPAGQIAEPDGWLTGPSADGPRALACRYATTVHAVWAELLKSDTSHAFCATGNSGGGALVGYAITQYGMGNSAGPGPVFALAEATSGPPYARIDHACAGTAAPTLTVNCPANQKISENFGLQTAENFVDPTYSSAVCSADITSAGKKPYANFRHDSIVSDDFSTPSYKTVVRVLFGANDLTEAVPLGTEWYNAIKSTKAAVCVANAPHELPANYTGASTIISDITSHCQ